MRRPICVKCQAVMRCKKNGAVVELLDGDLGYQKWAADMYECTKCKATVMSGYSAIPLAEDFQSNYEEHTPDCRVRFGAFS